jgi:hypothetical protein
MGRLMVVLLLALCATSCGSEERKAVTTTRPIGAPVETEATGLASTGNLAPSVESLSLVPAAPGAGDTVRAAAEATDPEGDGVRFRYEWTVNGEPAGRESTLSLRGVQRGAEVEVTVTALDATGESGPAYASARVANQPPVLRGIQIDPARKVTPGQDVAVVANGEDPDGDPVDYRYTWIVNGVRQAASGATFPTGDLESGDTLSVQVVATDGRAESAPLSSPEIPVGNAAPIIVSKPGAPGRDGVFRYQLHAEDPEGDRNLRYRVAEGPDGMTVTPLGGQVQWAPRPDQAGAHPIELVVEDSTGARSSQRFELTIDAPPAAPGP